MNVTKKLQSTKPLENVSSPEYLSCDEGEEYDNIFKSKCDLVPDEEIEIDYSFKNAISFVNYDSEKAIAAFQGCIRIGKVISKQLLNETEFGFNKNNLIEIPVYFIPKFVKRLKLLIVYFSKNEPFLKDDELIIGDVRHKISLYSKRSSLNNSKLISFFLKSNDQVIYELLFECPVSFKYFFGKLFNIILDTISPETYQQQLTINLLNNFKTKDLRLVNDLFGFWIKHEKLDILWKAVSEVVYEKEKKPSKCNTNLIYNFIKKNIDLVEALNVMFSIVNLK